MGVLDYYTGGMPMPGRDWTGGTGSYRFGHNTQEKVDEWNGTAGTHYTALFWEYDSRLNMRLNPDPKGSASVSPYACFNGNPILFSDVLGDTSRFYDRSNNSLLGTINDKGSLRNIKIDKDLYKSATSLAKKGNIKLEDQANANKFTSKLINTAKFAERSLNTEFIAEETGTKNLSFDGASLNINSEFDDASELPIAEYRAQSGIRNGRLRIPNGLYAVDNYDPQPTNMSMRRDGVHFSYDINGRRAVWDPVLNRNRTALEIHPDGEKNGNWQLNNGTLGCIGLQTNASLLNDFVRRIDTYLNTHNSIQLHVNY